MRFAKGGVIIENNNPVFDGLYLKQGWTPVLEEAEEVPSVDEPINQDTKDNGEAEEVPAVSGEADTVEPSVVKTPTKRTYQKRK